jgi:formylglycine-generating enzyme required for sulfatase activity
MFRGIRGTSVFLAAVAVVAACLTPGGARTGGAAMGRADDAGDVDSVQATPMVLIPAGEFLMGNSDGADSSPVHEVYLNAFYIDVHEVTNAQYFKFCRETGASLPEFWGMDVYRSGPDYPDHPVVGVSWSAAVAYAEWCGKRLPTEAEWERAARGGLVLRKYQGGDEIDSTIANYTKSPGPKPVCSYTPNGYGLCDMTGNVCEWCADYYRYDFYSSSPDSNPAGPETGKFRVIRGGGWHSGKSCCCVYYRNALPSNWRDFNVGFRCVRDCP